LKIIKAVFYSGHFNLQIFKFSDLQIISLYFAGMKRLGFCLLVVQLLFACNSNDKKATSENDLDAARNFLNAALDGKWNDAKTFLLQDSINVQLLETAENKYNQLSNSEKVSHMDAHPILHDSRNINDSITVVKYSNSYTNRKDSLKIVRISGQWLIDLKYSFFRTDSTGNVQ
jgi:hypothetical protein